jgi:membrane protease YdiL (CAAX protease family)
VTAGHWPVQRQVIVELGTLGALAALYVILIPQRPAIIDLALALLGLLAIMATAGDTRRRIWGAPAPANRARDSALLLTGTAAMLVLFAAVGGARVWRATGTWADVPEQLLRPSLPAAFAIFVLWALLQQMLFQFYLLGTLFGAVHLPMWDVAAVTAVGGTVWSWYYLKSRRLLPIAVSHAALGTTYFYWVRGRDLLLDWLMPA